MDYKQEILTDNRIPNIPFFYVAYRGWSHWRGKLTFELC
jgi:hypothetical protein